MEFCDDRILKLRIMSKKKTVKFIDLFAGLGGTRIGFEQACREAGVESECVFTSEIKEHAIRVYKENFDDAEVSGDITKILATDIPDFNVLIGGFPCQAFSFSGKRRGFADTRGTLFFDIARILKEKKPEGFILENVEGLIVHDRLSLTDKVGRTLDVILATLEDLGYKVSWRLLDSADFGVPQRRKRIYIVGSLKEKISLDDLEPSNKKVKSVLEKGKPIVETNFTKRILGNYPLSDLYGKSIKDKRGGSGNIHSWDLSLKGKVSGEQKKLLELLLRERRKKKWAVAKGIKWMDGMPLTIEEIASFFQPKGGRIGLGKALNDLVEKGYLVYEHPKELRSTTDNNGYTTSSRVKDISGPKGYNIISGKLSFEFSQILDPNGIAPTLVATDMGRIGVVDGKGIRRLTIREGLRLFGFPESYQISLPERQAYDLLGNSIAVPVVKIVSERLVRKLVG